MVHISNLKLEDLNREIEALQDKANKLEKDTIKSEKELISVLEQLDTSMGKNRELTKRIKQLENQMRAL
jgi:polyphosphate kinase 2 (PPK2 family)